MKRKNIQNSNGISVCDSIVMSVKNKRPNLRKPFSAVMAVIGFASVILSFLGMFDIRFDHSRILFSAAALALFYIVVTVIEGKALWLFVTSLFAYIIAAYKKTAEIILGFKFVYNIIYCRSFHTEILYYKDLNPSLEIGSVTTMMFFYIWLLAIIIFFFTICRPNPILPLLVSFPVIEIGLYNGVELPVLRGMLVVAYWLALLGMCSIDIGEYSGGQSGFVRKNNLFFPKRHMKLKVTEKCGALIMSAVIIVTFLSTGILKLINYKRSDELNIKRKNLSEAAENFSMDNIAESFADIMNAVGFEFKYENHKLGTNDHVTYKNVTDLQIHIDSRPDTALYIKDYAGADYHDNQWFDLHDSAYDDNRYADCETYGINPQDFPYIFSPIAIPGKSESTIWIKSLLKSRKTFTPYGVDNFGSFKYDKDKMVTSADHDKKEMTYKFIPMTAEMIAPSIGNTESGTYSAELISDQTISEMIKAFCNDHSLFTSGDLFTINHELVAPDDFLYSNGKILLTELLENNYKSFVYDNYLKVPETDAMKEVHQAYSDIIDSADISTAESRMTVLRSIRDRITADSEYSLRPGKTPSNRDFVNYFLLENHKGYCIHYATSGVMLARMAGIPARYATGYVVVGDDFTNETMSDDGTYHIDIKDNRSHAWAEVFIDGFGWVPFEFTAGYSDVSVNPEAPKPVPETTSAASSQEHITTKKTSGTITTASHTQRKSSTTQAAQNNRGTYNSKPKKHFPTFLIKLIVFIAAAVSAVILRRQIILSTRNKKFSDGDASDRVGHIYSYAEKLLRHMDIENKENRFIEFADQVEEKFGGTLFTSGEFKNMTQIALKSRFGNHKPTAEEIGKCRNTADKIASSMYEKNDLLGKLYMKFINVLI